MPPFWRIIWQNRLKALGFSGGSVRKESACNARDAEDVFLIPRSGRSPGEGNGYLLQYSCLENPTDEGTWRAEVHSFAESDMAEATKQTSIKSLKMSICFLKAISILKINFKKNDLENDCL